MNRRLIGVALALCVAAGLAGACSASSGSDAANTAALPKEASGSGGSAPADQKAGQQNIDQPGVDRTLIRTATMALTAGDVGETVKRVRGVATTEGGYSGQEEVRTDNASLTLRVPSDRFDHAISELSGLGKVTSLDQSAEDVTEQVVDLDSRIATQRASVDRVRALLARATTVDEIVRIEGELTNRESDLESLEQRRQALGGQAAMSTVTVRIAKSDAPAVVHQEASGFVAGLTDGWGAFLNTGGVTLQVLGAVLPFLLVLGIPGVFAYRWWRKRRSAAVSA